MHGEQVPEACTPWITNDICRNQWRRVQPAYCYIVTLVDILKPVDPTTAPAVQFKNKDLTPSAPYVFTPYVFLDKYKNF